MQRVFISILTVFLSTSVLAQADLQKLSSAERSFGQIAAQKGLKPAFLEVLADDGVVFQPGPVNGRQFWKGSDDRSPARLARTMIYADISSTGAMGFTSGSWELYPLGKPDSSTQFGEYVTIWERKPDGRYRVTLDIGVSHEKPTTKTPGSLMAIDAVGDLNLRGWSATDSALGFLRMGMTKKNLGGAYDKFAADDVRLFVDRQMPILGKKATVGATKHYNSILFPKVMSLLESGDMAYLWNPCEYSNSREGIEKGNCLQIWKFRNREWRIVIAVFARIIDTSPPSLKYRDNKQKKKT